MDEKQSIKSFLKGILELGEIKPEEPIKPVPKPHVAVPVSARPATPPPRAVRPADPPPRLAPQTEAYKNRKAGRKEHYASIDGLKEIIACIDSHGEVSPAQIAEELGIARSSLTYSMNRLMSNSPGGDKKKAKFDNPYLLPHLLGNRHIQRLGVGQTLRYRLVAIPPPETSTQEKPQENPIAEQKNDSPGFWEI
jgi:hypothetical protein